ncbi:hypothetical protein [Tannockella kyphosi]|uniref:hypothetical protein n=1 Tax=Tannockella kyphosi TaxID=2899121 RepID=UPI002011F5D0|nr:hypothetical protein [Tannockella kyphosi]
MSIQSSLLEIEKSLCNLEKTGVYDVEKFGHSLIHLTSQLEYFYCHLVKDGKGSIDTTYYRVPTRPSAHQLAYFNIGRGFPKELMDGHWCYVLKDLGYKMLVVPCTSIKSSVCNPEFEMDIKIKMGNEYTSSRIQLSDIRSIDMQRLDLRKPFCEVLTDKQDIVEFIGNNLLK